MCIFSFCLLIFIISLGDRVLLHQSLITLWCGKRRKIGNFVVFSLTWKEKLLESLQVSFVCIKINTHTYNKDYEF